MAGFFDNIYQMYGAGMFDPEADSGGGGGMTPVQWDRPEEDDFTTPTAPTGPRMIPPGPMSVNRPRPAYEALLAHQKEAPVNRPSTLEAIMAGIGGFATAWGKRDPGAGFATTQSLLDTPYQRKLSEWKAKGQSLEEAAKEEGRYMGDVMDYETNAGKTAVAATNAQTRKEELNAKIDQINKTYEIADKNATTAEAKLQAQKDRDLAMQGILKERNAIDRMEAETGRSRADSYGRYVDQLGAKGSAVVSPKVNELYNAEQDALMEILATDPKARKYFQVGEDGVVSPITDQEFTPEELYEREAIVGTVGVNAQKRLGGESMGGIPPLWSMRPPARIPSDRRRIQ